MKPTELLEFLKKAIPSRLPVLIKGAPGIGKTDICSQACEAAGAELILEHPVVSDPTDYKGLPFPDGKGNAEFLPFGGLKRIIDADKPAVFFLDDLGQSPMAVQAACMQLILARRINGHRVSNQVSFIAATNRRMDRAGVTGLLEPVKSRFVTIVELEPDVESWVSWALKAGLPTELIAFIRFRPELLSNFEPTNELTNSPNPRTVHNVGKLMQMGVPRDIELEVYSGAAGEGFAAELTGFLRIFRGLPNPDVILTNPEKADVPTDPATLYALCGALTHRASENTMERIVRYVARIQPEFSVKLMRDIVNKNADLVNTRAFIEWSSANSDVLM